jgi:guanosine-3',5'-bis(diphosphate) 3'-pyrophosphohydrolase
MVPARPSLCPRCGSPDVVPIHYGPTTDETIFGLAEGTIAIGGEGRQPQKWSCTDCGYAWPLPVEALQDTLVWSAFTFAVEAHEGQLRKGDDTPYIDHPVEVAHMLYEQGYAGKVIAAALLHDVVEDCDVSARQIEERFGADVAALVGALTADESVKDYVERKDEHRAGVRWAGSPATAIYAADKLANLRALNAAYAVQGEELGERFNAPLDEKEKNASKDIEMLETVKPRSPFLDELRVELEKLRRQRGRV